MTKLNQILINHINTALKRYPYSPLQAERELDRVKYILELMHDEPLDMNIDENSLREEYIKTRRGLKL